MGKDKNTPEDILVLTPQQILFSSFEDLKKWNPQIYEILSEKVRGEYFEKKLYKDHFSKLADQLIDCINQEVRE